MNRSTLIGIGALAAGAVLAGLALKRRESGLEVPDDAEGPCCGDPVCGGKPRQPVAVPGGWRRATGAEATPYAGTARSILGTHASAPFGTLVPIDASTAAFIEQHCHEPGGPVRPWGYHTGVTILKAA